MRRSEELPPRAQSTSADLFVVDNSAADGYPGSNAFRNRASVLSTSTIEEGATVDRKAQRHYRYSQGAVPGELPLSWRLCLLWAAGLAAAVAALSYLIR
jgi:hypothetical protein